MDVNGDGRPADSPERIAFAYVGAVVPDRDEYHNEAFHRGASLFQQQLLAAIGEAGVRPSAVFSAMPVRAYGNGGPILVRGRSDELLGGIQMRLLPLLNLPWIRNAWSGVAALMGICRWRLRERRPGGCRIICLFNTTYPSGVFVLAAARTVGARAVLMLNDVNTPGSLIPDNPLTRLDFLLTRLVVPKFDGHIAVSEALMRRYAPGRPYVLIDGGVSQETLLRGRQRLQARHSEATFTIAFAGSLTPHNGVAQLLEGFSLLQGDRYRLVVAGRGVLDPLVRDAARRDARIEFRGELGFAEVLDLYDEADAVVNMRITQRLDTDDYFPSKLLELLASGVAVISTCTGHVESEYGDFCFLLHDESPEGLCKILQHVDTASYESRRETAERAWRYVAANKTWEAHGARVVEYFREVTCR